MTLPVSGPISLSQVNTELGRGATSSISMNDTNVRGLAGIPSGSFGMNSLRGKSSSAIILTTAYDGGLNYGYQASNYLGHAYGSLVPNVWKGTTVYLFGSWKNTMVLITTPVPAYNSLFNSLVIDGVALVASPLVFSRTVGVEGETDQCQWWWSNTGNLAGAPGSIHGINLT